MWQLNLASCSGPRGRVIQLKFGICEGFIQNLCRFSARQIGGKGLPCPRGSSQGGGPSSTQSSVLPQGHGLPLPPKTWESSSKVTDKLQRQDLLASCSGLWKIKNHRGFRDTEDYCDYLLFVNHLSNVFYTWRRLYRCHLICIFKDCYVNILVIMHMLTVQMIWFIIFLW